MFELVQTLSRAETQHLSLASSEGIGMLSSLIIVSVTQRTSRDPVPTPCPSGPKTEVQGF